MKITAAILFPKRYNPRIKNTFPAYLVFENYERILNGIDL